jgi:glycosyltransferase involved in cell wall biosynthesis
MCEIKIYDCSNSPDRPPHRGGGGPVTNDVMRILHECAEDYAVEFTDDLAKASVVITNDVFPKKVLETGLPLVKRMCSPFWHKDFLSRNEKLNEAARQADKVIFISDYSKEQYFHLYGFDIKNYAVSLNWITPKVFKNFDSLKEDRFTLVAIATNWNRKEKRLCDIIKLAKMYPDIQITLIGTADMEVPDNINKIGYLEDYSMIVDYLNFAHGFVNFSYRDAAPKVVAQAISCGLPVLFANSGGTIELVQEFGTDIKDDISLDVLDYVPELKEEDIAKGYKQFRKDFDDMQSLLRSFDSKLTFRKMVDGYFSSIIETIPQSKEEIEDE